MKTEIWAHRGASRDEPENTMAAFEKACKDGADGLEMDVQRTKDGELVVFHDEALGRLTGDPRQLKDLTRKELRALRVANAHDIPLLADVLRFCKEQDLRLNIELKNSVHLYPGLEEEIAELVRDAGLFSDRIIYSSFNHLSIQKMKSIDPKAPVGLLYAGILHEPWNYAKTLGADALHPMLNSLQIPDFVKHCHAEGIRVHTWTADEDAHILAALALGADAVITNVPAHAVRLRESFVRDPAAYRPVLRELGLEV
ncbi:MAG: glycerophosphodiester phosphodiesterase family protein [Peptoniphilaceae bacterium]|jgi:glycerophosphoryl diester phosphodiesterase|nr:glycerophosphodiester phosphodiesterase family protein [Bacillota bacterium]